VLASYVLQFLYIAIGEKEEQEYLPVSQTILWVVDTPQAPQEFKAMIESLVRGLGGVAYLAGFAFMMLIGEWMLKPVFHFDFAGIASLMMMICGYIMIFTLPSLVFYAGSRGTVSLLVRWQRFAAKLDFYPLSRAQDIIIHTTYIVLLFSMSLVLETFVNQPSAIITVFAIAIAYFIRVVALLMVIETVVRLVESDARRAARSAKKQLQAAPVEVVES
jgi:hypothetical protein